MTNHSYFNLAGHASGTACNAKVWLDADAFTETDAELIPTGTVIPVEGTPMDFREGKKVAKEIGADYKPLKLAGGYDHNWVLNGSGFRKAASAESEETGIKMEVYTDLPGIQFYSGNFLAGAKGKGRSCLWKGFVVYALKRSISRMQFIKIILNLRLQKPEKYMIQQQRIGFADFHKNIRISFGYIKK